MGPVAAVLLFVKRGVIRAGCEEVTPTKIETKSVYHKAKQTVPVVRLDNYISGNESTFVLGLINR